MALKDNKAVVNVQGDENDLEALFRVIRKPNENAGMKKEPILPMRMRKLPPSFFTPNGAVDFEGRPAPVKGAPEINPATGLTIIHSRAHSSPASFTVPKQNKKAVNPMQVLHMRSQSYDASESNNNHLVGGPLPPGWEAATTSDGQKYFMNHIDQSTTWIDPRKTRSTSNLATLPEGWQQAITPGRELYFVNHMNRTTSWVDPRLSNMNTGQSRPAGPPPAPPPPPPQNNGIEKVNQMQLHRLQMEKQMLQRRQQQLLQQEIVIKRGLLTKEDDSSSMLMNLSREAFMGIPNNEPQPQPTLTSRHMREESADSGLGLGNFYPGSDLEVVGGNFDDLHENFGSKESLHQQNNNNNLRPGQLPDCFDLMPSSNVDVGLMDTDSVIGMDTDDLGVGLEAINSDLMLSDVEAALGNTNKIDSFLSNLNWV